MPAHNNEIALDVICAGNTGKRSPAGEPQPLEQSHTRCIVCEDQPHHCPDAEVRGMRDGVFKQSSSDTAPLKVFINVHAQLDGATISATRQKWFADRKSTRLNSSHSQISYAVFCLKK